MVDAMSIPDAAQPGKTGEEGDRKPSVHEPVVHDHVGDAERGHPGADADRDRRRGSVQIASNHHERGGDGRVRGGQRVVGLEATAPVRVVRPVNAPQRVVPHVPVEETSPGLHRRGDRQGHGETQQHELRRRHEVTP